MNNFIRANGFTLPAFATLINQNVNVIVDDAESVTLNVYYIDGTTPELYTTLTREFVGKGIINIAPILQAIWRDKRKGIYTPNVYVGIEATATKGEETNSAESATALITGAWNGSTLGLTNDTLYLLDGQTAVKCDFRNVNFNSIDYGVPIFSETTATQFSTLKISEDTSTIENVTGIKKDICENKRIEYLRWLGNGNTQYLHEFIVGTKSLQGAAELNYYQYNQAVATVGSPTMDFAQAFTSTESGKYSVYAKREEMQKFKDLQRSPYIEQLDKASSTWRRVYISAATVSETTKKSVNLLTFTISKQPTEAIYL